MFDSALFSIVTRGATVQGARTLAEVGGVALLMSPNVQRTDDEIVTIRRNEGAGVRRGGKGVSEQCLHHAQTGRAALAHRGLGHTLDARGRLVSG